MLAYGLRYSVQAVHTIVIQAARSCIFVSFRSWRSRNLGTTFSAHVEEADSQDQSLCRLQLINVSIRLVRFINHNYQYVTRSVTGFITMLADAAIVAVSRRQHCISMSSCEAELDVALADAAARWTSTRTSSRQMRTRHGMPTAMTRCKRCGSTTPIACRPQLTPMVATSMSLTAQRSSARPPVARVAESKLRRAS